MRTADNPLGLNGFEFCEFTSPNPDAMAAQFEQLGFVPASTHPTKQITRYKQGRINLLLNREAQGQAADFRALHGASASGMAFRVANAREAYDHAIANGAKGTGHGQRRSGSTQIGRVRTLPPVDRVEHG